MKKPMPYPIKFLKTPNIFSNWFFGAKSKEEKKLLSEILIDTNPVFLKWAINQILNWQNTEFTSNVIHIHGTSDRILPIRFVKYDIKIENGGHFMTINKAKEINMILNDLLQ